MNNIVTKTAVFAVICLICSNAAASPITNTYTMIPSDRDLDDLDHYWHYSWGIDTPWDITPDENGEYERVVGATLSFDNIRNWDNNPNVLYIHLLDTARLGVRQGYDHQGYGNHFEDAGPELVTYINLPSTSQDLTYEFTEDELSALDNFAFDGRFGLGFDPDCHFYNRGVQLEVRTETATTPVVPEPATMAIMLAGGVAVIRRKRRGA